MAKVQQIKDDLSPNTVFTKVKTEGKAYMRC